MKDQRKFVILWYVTCTCKIPKSDFKNLYYVAFLNQFSSELLNKRRFYLNGFHVKCSLSPFLYLYFFISLSCYLLFLSSVFLVFFTFCLSAYLISLCKNLTKAGSFVFVLDFFKLAYCNYFWLFFWKTLKMNWRDK